MRDKIYLTIDLSYWSLGEFSISDRAAELSRHDVPTYKRRTALQFIHRLFTEVPRERISVSRSHCDAVPHINWSGPDKIINIDFFSDLSVCTQEEKLDMGNWANFVTHRGSMEYEWRFPSKDQVWEGMCNARDVFRMSQKNAYALTGWNCLRRVCGLRSIPFQLVYAANIILNPWNVPDTILVPVVTYLRSYGRRIPETHLLVEAG